MSTHDRAGRPYEDRRAMDWREAFCSGDPATQWAAACSVADVVTSRDRWIDSTALHEARCGAFDAGVAAAQADPDSAIPAAIAGARRALYWERTARARLVPAVSLGARRWRVQRRTTGDVDQFVSLAAVAEAEDAGAVVAFHPPPTTGWCDSSTLAAVADRLAAAGWPWPIPPGHAIEDAVQAVLAVGRDRAAACLADMYPDLPAAVVDGVVMLVAGSRRRIARPWPGVVWLLKHRGIDATLADAGTRAVIDGLITGRHARPSSAAGATIVDRATRRLQLVPTPAPPGGNAAAANPTRRTPHPMAVAS